MPSTHKYNINNHNHNNQFSDKQRVLIGCTTPIFSHTLSLFLFPFLNPMDNNSWISLSCAAQIHSMIATVVLMTWWHLHIDTVTSNRHWNDRKTQTATHTLTIFQVAMRELWSSEHFKQHNFVQNWWAWTNGTQWPLVLSITYANVVSIVVSNGMLKISIRIEIT